MVGDVQQISITCINKIYKTFCNVNVHFIRLPKFNSTFNVASKYKTYEGGQ